MLLMQEKTFVKKENSKKNKINKKIYLLTAKYKISAFISLKSLIQSSASWLVIDNKNQAFFFSLNTFLI